MPRGYMEGPASEEAERRAEEHARGIREQTPAKKFPAVYGSTSDNPEPHFIGWRLDELFDRQRGQRLDSRRAAGSEGDRHSSDRRRVGRLDHVHEVELAERGP